MAKKTSKSPYDERGRWKDEKRLVIGAIRRLFRQSPQFKEVIEASRVEVPRYNKDGSLSKKPYVKRTCEVCGQLFSSGNIAVDHIEPMVPLHLTNEDLTYEEIVRNIVCDRSNLQRICNPKKGKGNKPKFLEFCHQKKTHRENFFRKKWQDFFEKLTFSLGKTRNAKDHMYRTTSDRNISQWNKEYEQELELQLKELADKEERKRLRAESKLLKSKQKRD